MFRLVKRSQVTLGIKVRLRLLTILIALMATGIIIGIGGYNPIQVYIQMVVGSLGSLYRFQETIVKMIPLLVMALGVAVCFKMDFINIGAEGQFYVGAMGATFIALNFSSLPIYILLPLMFLVAFLMAGIWCLIPAILKIRLGTSEVLVTLMLNYVAIKFVSYLQYGPWRDPEAHGFPRIATFSDSAILPEILGIQSGWIIALVLVILIYIFLTKTSIGYELSIFGKSPRTADYAGIDKIKVVLFAALIGGGLSGIAGMIQASGVEHSLTDELSVGLGYTAIVVAWLGNLSAPMIALASFAFAVLIQGSSYIQTSMQIPSASADVLQGMILIFVLASEVLTKYRICRVSTEKEV